MNVHWQHQYIRLFNHSPRLAAASIIIYILFCLGTLFSSQHVAFNLEPYPDSLYYIGMAKSLASGSGFRLNESTSFQPEISWLYPALLSPFYTLSNHPMVFVLANTILSGVGLWMVWKLTYLRTPKLAIYALWFLMGHAILWFLPTLAMAETLVWVACAGSLLALENWLRDSKLSQLMVFWTTCLVIGLAKFSAVPVALGLASIPLLLQLKKFSLPILIAAAASLVVHVSFVLHFQVNSLVRLLLTGDHNFFSFSYIPLNLSKYIFMILGMPTFMLWENIFLTVPLITVASYTFLIYHSRKSRFKWSLLLASAAHLPLLLLFYDVNARYVISWLPIFAIVWSESLNLIHPNKVIFGFNLRNTLVTISLLLLILVQLPMFFTMFKQTIFRNSRAWQFESVQNISYRLQSLNNPVIVSALPPQLFSWYSPNFHAEILPLSMSQEFISKSIFIWPTPELKNISPTQLIELRLKQGRAVYVTNAYITHARQVTADFEELKNSFVLTQLDSGCQNACILYHVSARSD